MTERSLNTPLTFWRRLRLAWWVVSRPKISERRFAEALIYAHERGGRYGF